MQRHLEMTSLETNDVNIIDDLFLDTEITTNAVVKPVEQEEFLNFDRFFSAMNQESCIFCSTDIFGYCKICCMECDVVSCPVCFSKGLEINNHKRTHSYTVIEASTNEIYTPGWSSSAELGLIEGISRNGFKWEGVAEFVGVEHSAAECKQHYDDLYWKPEGIPDLSMTAEAIAEAKIWMANGSVPASMRDDVDVEWDNDAELPMADMFFGPDEAPIHIQIKMNVALDYCERTEERWLRKSFARSFGILKGNNNYQSHKFRQKDEEDLYKVFRPLARFCSGREEFEELLQLILEEQRILERCSKLAHFKRLGATRYSQVGEEVSKKKQGNGSKGRNLNPSNNNNNINNNSIMNSKQYGFTSHTPDLPFANLFSMASPVNTISPSPPPSTTTTNYNFFNNSTNRISSMESNNMQNVSAVHNKSPWGVVTHQQPYFDSLNSFEQKFCADVGLPPAYFLYIKQAMTRWGCAFGEVQGEVSKADDSNQAGLVMLLAAIRSGDLIEIAVKDVHVEQLIERTKHLFPSAELLNSGVASGLIEETQQNNLMAHMEMSKHENKMLNDRNMFEQVDNTDATESHAQENMPQIIEYKNGVGHFDGNIEKSFEGGSEL